jgi:hypothetical protein
MPSGGWLLGGLVDERLSHSIAQVQRHGKNFQRRDVRWSDYTAEGKTPSLFIIIFIIRILALPGLPFL